MEKIYSREPLVVSGPSGSGKSFLVRELSRVGFGRVIPTTTRSPRPGERNGEDYYFIEEEQYLDQERAGDFFMSNDFLGARYGFQTESVLSHYPKGRRPAAEVFTPTIQQFLDAFPDSQTVYLMPQNLNIIKSRMEQRGDHPDRIRERLLSASAEISYFYENVSQHYEQVFKLEEQGISSIVTDICNLRRQQGRHST